MTTLGSRCRTPVHALTTLLILISLALGPAPALGADEPESPEANGDAGNEDNPGSRTPLQELDDLLPTSFNTGWSGATTRIYPPSRVLLGAGFSTLSDSVRHRAIMAHTPSQGAMVPLSRRTDDLQIEYNFRLIDSLQDLAETLSIGASASYGGFFGSASARYNLYRSARISSRSVYALISLSMTSAVEQLDSFNLTPEAAKTLRLRSPSDYFATYGDTFVYRVGYGAELFALLEFRYDTRDERNAVSAAVSASIGAFKADASFATTLKELTENRSVKVLYSQVGGATGRPIVPPAFDPNGNNRSSGGVLTISPAELEFRIRDFPHEVRSHPETAKVIWADLLDYYAVGNRPKRATFYDLTAVRWTLEDLASLTRDLEQVRHTWSESLASGRAATNQCQVDENRDQNQLTFDDISCLDDALRLLRRAAELLIANPSRLQAIRSSVGDKNLPSPRHLRAYVHNLTHTSQPNAQAVADKCKDIEQQINVIVSKHVPDRTPIAPLLSDRMQSDRIDVGARGAGNHAFSVRFTRPFQRPPIVVATVTANTVANNDRFIVSLGEVTTTGFEAHVCRQWNGACIPWGQAIAIDWIATPRLP